MTADNPPGIGFAAFDYADYATSTSTTTEISIPVGYHPTRLFVLRAVRDDHIVGDLWCPPDDSITSQERINRRPGIRRALTVLRRWGLIVAVREGRYSARLFPPMILTPLGALVLDDWTLREADGDRSDCPYLRGTGDRKCNQGCWEEPRCVIEEPVNGWPMTRARVLRGDV